MPIRLSRETSPYLRQHAENPVDWYPRGGEAFRRAREEDKRRTARPRQACGATGMGAYRAHWRLRLEQRRSAGRRLIPAAATPRLNARGLSCLFVHASRTIHALSCLHPHYLAEQLELDYNLIDRVPHCCYYSLVN